MVAVVLGSVVSFGIALFALTLTYREFARHWPQVVAALFPAERLASPAFAPEVRRSAAPRQAWPAPVRAQPMRRAAA